MNKTLTHIDANAFACLKEKLKIQGIELKDNEGYLSKNGISLDYAFDAELETMEIQNLKVGFPASMVGMSAEKVMDILEKAVADCRS